MSRFVALNLVLLFFLSLSAAAQNNLCRVYGRVTDSVSLQPIPDVSVFVPFTSRGTITNAKGEYNLDQLTAGEVQVSFRHIAYTPQSRFFSISPNDSIQCDLQMTEATIEISEVTKQAGSIDWVYGMILFKEMFLGDPYETSCILKNPRDLSFYFDGDVIYGQAKQPLKISNSYLGYDITYYLDYFKFDKNKNPATGLGTHEYFAYGGLALYTGKNAHARVKKTKWKNNREEEFRISLKHFLQDLYQDTTSNKKFCLREVEATGPDSVFYWDMGQSKGSFIRYSSDKEFIAGDNTLVSGPDPGLKTLRLSGPLLVFFREPMAPVDSVQRVCLLEADRGLVVFDGDGNYRLTGGNLNWIYLDNQKRLRNMLPMDYDPAAKNEAGPKK